MSYNDPTIGVQLVGFTPESYPQLRILEVATPPLSQGKISMTLADYLAAELGGVHRPRTAMIYEAIKEGVPQAVNALLVISHMVGTGEMLGEERIEDFELTVHDEVTTKDLRRLIIAYYEPSGFRINPARDFSGEGVFLFRENDEVRETLHVNLSNNSGWISIPAIGLFPFVLVTCNLTRKVKA